MTSGQATSAPNPEDPSLEGPKRLLTNLQQRMMTSLILMPLVMVAVVLGGWAFLVVIGVVAAVGVMEFYHLARRRSFQGSTVVGLPATVSVILAFHYDQPAYAALAIAMTAVAAWVLETVRHPRAWQQTLLQTGMTLAGVAYIGLPAAFIVGVRNLPDGLTWLLVVLALTWGTDSLAYIGGRLWGRKPLAPVISPKKTVEGAVVGYLGGLLVAGVVLLLGGKASWAAAAMIALGPLVAIGGDLLESGLKRVFDVKDSFIPGLNLFPGHGGVLDRVDALICVGTFCYLWIRVFNLA